MQIITHPMCLEHQVQTGHPERPERLSHLLNHLDRQGFDRTAMRTATSAGAASVARAHPSSYLATLEAAHSESDLVALDADTWMGPRSFDAALYAAGALNQATAEVLAGNEKRIFCAVRPPGHHAESDAAMGFCILNSIAIGALTALEDPSIERVAILDFDVHHGNGTVEIFREDPRVLVCSTFQHPFYPHRFYENDWPNVVNTPLRAGTRGDGFRLAVERDWGPALKDHAPDLIYVSAGFDAHAADPLAQLDLEVEDFAWVTSWIVDQSERTAAGRVISTLEGGYDLDALAASVTAHLHALA